MLIRTYNIVLVITVTNIFSFIWKNEIFVLPLFKIKYICCYKIVKLWT